MLLPFPPTITSVTNDTAAGPVVISFFITEPSRTTAFAVAHNRFPTNMNTSNQKKLFEAGLKQAIGVDGRLISETDVTLRDYPGREWVSDQFRGRQ